MISYYELLGMIKDGKEPRKIRVHLTSGTSKLYVREDDMDGTFSFYGLGVNEKENEEYHFYLPECFLESSMFDLNIEIIEEEKKILEKIEYYHQYDECVVKDKFYQDQKGSLVDEIIIDKLNEVLDYLNSKGE